MDIRKLSLLSLVAAVWGGIQRRESVNFPLRHCSTNEVDFVFLYFDSRDHLDRRIQKAVVEQFAMSIERDNDTTRLQYAEFYDSFSASKPDVNVSSWRFQPAIESLYTLWTTILYTHHTAKKMYDKDVNETIKLKLTFVKRLFAEMAGVRENATHVAVVFLDGQHLSLQESRRVPYIIQQQDKDIKILVNVFGIKKEKHVVFAKNTLLLGKQHVWDFVNMFLLAVCGQCRKDWLFKYKSQLTNSISCYFYNFYPNKLSWNNAEVFCKKIGASFVTIETEEEFEFIRKQLARTNSTRNFHIGLKRDSTHFARRFYWSQTLSGQTYPLVLNHWLPGQPSSSLSSGCVMWTFVLNETRGSGSGDWIYGWQDGWVDVACGDNSAEVGLCEIGLPGRVDDRNMLSIKPANKESFNRALGKGRFIVFMEHLVSVLATISSTNFVDDFNQTYTDYFPLFDCGMVIPGPQYISYLFVCDGVEHCSNRRDEMFCVYKPGDPVECGSVSCCDGYCLPIHRVGDGVVDCKVCSHQLRSADDDESEALVVDMRSNKNCALFCRYNGRVCVEFSALNDSHMDCTDPGGPLDETIGKLETVDTCQNILGHRVWAPRCVYVKDIYGAVLGCRDLSHLEGCTDFKCPEGYFKCPDTYCIPQHYVLDGTVDCPAGEEENIDAISPCTGNFACWDSKVCLHPDLVCDGHPDCPHQDDEVDCHVTCPEGLRCISGTATVNDYRGFVNIDSLDIKGSSTRYLDLSRIDLSTSEFLFLKPLHNLQVFICSKCNIDVLNDEFIEHTHGLQTLDLSYNLIKILDGMAIYDPLLENIRHLNLSNNRELSAVTNLPLRFLETLDLSHTSLSQLKESDLASFPSLKHLNLSFTKITNIHKNTFPSRLILLTLNLRGLALKDFREDFFNGLTISQDLYTDSFELCCPQIRGPNIQGYACHAPDDAISSCFYLVGVDVQRVLLWVVAVLAVLGNMTVIVYRVIWDRSVLRTGYGLFVTNLGVSDFIMGVYLFIIAGANYYYRRVYVLFDKSWRENYFCSVAGFLATLSCETSTFFIFLITLDRFLVMKFPFGQIKFNKVTKMVAVTMSWTIGFLLALTPIVFQFEIYSSNAMCLGLPLTTEQLKGWEFSFVLFIVLNFCLFLLIVYGQRAIFGAITENSMSHIGSRRTNDITIAKQLSLVAISDFLCWFPVGLLGLLSLGGHEISNDVYAWTTVIVLPINSAANPLLYTIPALMAKWERFKHGETRPTQPTASSSLSKFDKAVQTVQNKESSRVDKSVQTRTE